MGITEGHLDELAFSCYTVTDTDELLTDFETFRDTDHHIVDESPVKAVHTAEARTVGRAGELDLISLNGDCDVGIDFLAHLTFGAFHLHDIAVEKFCLDAGGKDYR